MILEKKLFASWSLVQANFRRIFACWSLVLVLYRHFIYIHVTVYDVSQLEYIQIYTMNIFVPEGYSFGRGHTKPYFFRFGKRNRSQNHVPKYVCDLKGILWGFRHNSRIIILRICYQDHMLGICTSAGHMWMSLTELPWPHRWSPLAMCAPPWIESASLNSY